MIDVENYNKNRGIYSPLVEHNGIACGFWMCGQDYKTHNGYYGGYPQSYLKRMKLLYPLDNPDAVIMHLFSGKVQRGLWHTEILVDSNPELSPTIVCDAERISTLASLGSIDVIFADPPYNNNHRKYGTKKVNKRKVLKECVKLLKVGGHLVWLDTIIPQYCKADGWKMKGTIGLVQSTNHLTRTITILEKVPQ